MINKIEKHFDKIGYLVLGCFFIYFNLLLFKNMDLLIDSDMASEMLYGNLMMKTRSLFLKEWYYSTAIETLDIPLVFAPLFMFTNNWHVVRIVGIIILDLMLYCSFYYVCKALKLKHIPWVGLLILGTISNEYFDFVLKGSYYIPYLAVSFLSTGLLLDSTKSKSRIKVLILMVLSVISGLNGLRQIAQCYCCLFGASFLVMACKQYKNLRHFRFDNKEDTFVMTLISFGSLICSFIGYFLNKLLLEPNYSFMSDWGIKLEVASLKRILDVIYGWITMLGYETGKSWSILIGCLFAALIIFSCVYVVLKFHSTNKEYLFIVFLFVISSAITLAIFAFTSMTFAIRYFIQVFTNCIFVIAIMLSEMKFDIRKTAVIMIMTCVVIMCSTYQINKDIKKSTNNELIDIKDILLKEEVREGFGSFWNANVLTEMSDGVIEVWNFHNYEEDDDVSIKDIDKWLQKKEHFERNPEGRLFIILTYRQNEKIGFIKDVSDKLVYEGKERLMYIFDNYKELETSIYG